MRDVRTNQFVVWTDERSARLICKMSYNVIEVIEVVDVRSVLTICL